MEDIMLIRSSFMRRIISQIINKALKKQAPGVEVELKEAQELGGQRAEDAGASGAGCGDNEGSTE